jgi:Immunity protein Imm1
MFRSAQLEWSEAEAPTLIESASALRKQLEALHSRHARSPIVVQLGFDGGVSLYIGVGSRETAVTIHEPIVESDWTREWISVGDPSRQGEVHFYLFGHHTPHPARNVIPFDVALECAVHYFETRRRLCTVRWLDNRF